MSRDFSIQSVPNGLVNAEVKSKPKRVPTVPAHLPKLHCLCGAFGVVRSGKTNAIVNLIKEYVRHGSLNLLYCISPTYDSNSALQTLQFEAVFKNSEGSIQSLEKILDLVSQRNKEYEAEKKYHKAYRRWLNSDNEHDITWEDHNLLLKENYRLPVKIEWPKPAIFIDDMTHTELMANTIHNKLSHLSLHHRHLDNVGISIFQAFQTFKQGMPKVVRSNLGLIMLFPTCNMKEIEDIYKEVSNNITFDTFKELLFEATKGQHDFLLIDKLCDDPCKQFGINFDRKFIIDPVLERAKLLRTELNDLNGSTQRRRKGSISTSIERHVRPGDHYDSTSSSESTMAKKTRV